MSQRAGMAKGETLGKCMSISYTTFYWNFKTRNGKQKLRQ